ncbi:MAG: LapA family protein [Candidatus Leucobacter sulfamidivorax]|nr:LapA family protein [Candidatus Leucobacter sulfamidivorax]
MSGSTHEKTGGSFAAKAIIAGILVVLAVIFAILNSGSTTLNLFGLQLTLPGWIWLIALLLIGFIVGSLFPWFSGRKKS